MQTNIKVEAIKEDGMIVGWGMKSYNRMHLRLKY